MARNKNDGVGIGVLTGIAALFSTVPDDTNVNVHDIRYPIEQYPYFLGDSYPTNFPKLEYDTTIPKIGYPTSSSTYVSDIRLSKPVEQINYMTDYPTIVTPPSLLEYHRNRRSNELKDAIRRGDINTVTLLLKDTDPGQGFYTALENENKEIIKILLEKGVKPTRIEMQREADLGHYDIFNMFLKTGNNHMDDLYPYVKAGNVEIVKMFLESGTYPSGYTFDVAVRLGNPEIVKLFLDHGADPNRKRVLEYAIESGNLEIVEMLLNKGAKPKTKISSELVSAKMESLANKHDYKNFNIYLKAGYIHMDDLYPYVKAGNVEIVKMFLESGAYPSGYTFDVAVRLGKPEIVKLFLDHGADPNRKRVLEYAIESGNPEIVELLLQKGVRPTKIEIEEAITGGNEDIINILKKVNVKDGISKNRRKSGSKNRRRKSGSKNRRRKSGSKNRRRKSGSKRRKRKSGRRS